MAAENTYSADRWQPRWGSAAQVVVSGDCGTQRKEQRPLEGTMVLSRRVVGKQADCSCHVVTEPTWIVLGFVVTQGGDFIGPEVCI